MPRTLKGKEVVRILEKAGFVAVRTSGSHTIMQRVGVPNTISVPVHAGKDIKAGTLRGIIRSAGMRPEEFWSFDT